MFRLSPITFFVCGLVLILVTWAGFWFFSISKTRTEIGYWEKHVAELRQIASAESQKAAQERVRTALEKVSEAEQEWKLIADTRTPSMGRMNLMTHRWQSTVDVRKWHSQVEADLRSWIQKSGVRILQPVQNAEVGPFVPYPTDLPNELVEFYFHYPAIPFPVCVWDLGTITVEGTYDQITNHVRSWTKIPGYVAMVRGLGITGTGSRLRGSYNLVVVAYVNTEYVFGGAEQSGRIPDLSAPAQGAGGQQGSGTGERPRPRTSGGTGGGPVGGGAAAGGGVGGGAAE